ncbi:hypothetical protein CBW24_03735 [Pacificitalea manganoxidans]|uniref:SIMPL domain-containing protein n=1 Tax=Pacificitalea manganoxidans TaxID=1411902 RepID=A0A291LX30_9RHOB|nr:SIMPL domain-containing protein [Pacificitalea manganoxidans]ATI41197.1 hypothetical protein CBW24_03735 [Pacificitalea manganoxidans]MDR6308581.1 hypothetical protein [Pacificitalea manganoxidans]
MIRNLPTKLALAVVMAGLGTGAAAVLPSGAAQAQATPPVAGPQTPGRVVVRGAGVVKRAPDMATIVMGVEERAETADAALDAANEVGAAILERLTAEGIAARDVQTSGLSLSPERRMTTRDDTQPPEVVGFIATNLVTVTVRDLERLGPLLDTVVRGDGANRFQQLSFDLADPAPAEEDARMAAVTEARAKAETLAQAAGVSLGRIVEITEESAGRPMYARQEMRMADSGGVPVAPGEIEVRVDVGITFEIGSTE